MVEKCFCITPIINHSCEAVMEKVNDGYQISSSKRFCFDKEDNCIIGGKEVPGDIPSCRRSKEEYFDTVQEFKERLNNPKKLTGHQERSIANDHRSGKSHGKHFHQR